MRGKWFEIWIHRSCYLHPITAGEWGRLMIGNVEECADRIVIHHQLQIFRKQFMSPHLSCLLPLCLSGEFAFYGWAEFADESYWRAVWTRISKPYISLYVGCFHFGLHVMYMKYMCTWVCTHICRRSWRTETLTNGKAWHPLRHLILLASQAKTPFSTSRNSCKDRKKCKKS